MAAGTTRPHLFFSLDREILSAGAPSPCRGVAVLVVPAGSQGIQASSVYVRIRGLEKPSWYEGVGQSRHCTSDNVILDEKVFLRAVGSGDTTRRLPDGTEDSNDDDDDGGAPQVFAGGQTYTFPVKISIPADSPGVFVDQDKSVERQAVPWVMPTSPDGRIALALPRSLGAPSDRSRITYSAQVVVDLGGGADEASTPNLESDVLELSVVERFDPALLSADPLETSVSEKFFMGNGPIEITARVPRAGACLVGRRLPVEIFVRNGSTKRVSELKTVFWRIITFTAGTSTLTRRAVVFEGAVPNSEVLPGASYNAELLVDIPASTLPTVASGTGIKRLYELQIEGVVARSTSNIVANMIIPIFAPAPDLAPEVDAAFQVVGAPVNGTDHGIIHDDNVAVPATSVAPSAVAVEDNTSASDESSEEKVNAACNDSETESDGASSPKHEQSDGFDTVNL